MSDAASYIASRARRVDNALARLLPRATARPARLHAAMRHSLFAGGKRLRPVLCIAACEAFGGREDDALPAACALECVHTYSLIHDDLPCMDDDDLRRGKPTCHKVFGEAMAILAGDALLALAFEILQQSPPERVPALVGELARASGSRKLVGGQAEDLLAEGRPVSLADVRRIHEGKTAAMIAASVTMGAISAGAGVRERKVAAGFGRDLGLAFQIVDDILDETQTSTRLGKSAGKDARDAKPTYARVAGIDAARREARRLTRKAMRSLESGAARPGMLTAIAAHLLEREF